jgi:hypothetical protein
LTHNQLCAFVAVLASIQFRGRPPTVRELMKMLGLHNPNVAYQYLITLTAKGLLEVELCGNGTRTPRGLKPLYRLEMV